MNTYLTTSRLGGTPNLAFAPKSLMVTAPPNHPRFPSVEQETLSVEAALSWYIDDYPGEAQMRGISAIVRVRDNQGNAVTDLATDAFSFIP